MFGCMNLASFIMLVTSSRPSFLIFQFLSPILDTSSAVILSLQEKKEGKQPIFLVMCLLVYKCFNTTDFCLESVYKHKVLNCSGSMSSGCRTETYPISVLGKRSTTSFPTSSCSSSSPSSPPPPLCLEMPRVGVGAVCPCICKQCKNQKHLFQFFI